MPSKIVKQPNGLYARFSTIVDNFTHYGMDRQEAWRLRRDEFGVEAANSSLKDADEHGEWWDDCILTIRAVHSAQHASERVKEILEDT